MKEGHEELKLGWGRAHNYLFRLKAIHQTSCGDISKAYFCDCVTCFLKMSVVSRVFMQNVSF